MTLADATRLELEAMWMSNIRRLANIGARVAANAWLLRPQLAAARQQTVWLLHVRAAVLSLCWQGLEVSGTVVQEASVGRVTVGVA